MDNATFEARVTELVKDSRDKFREAAVEALSYRCGVRGAEGNEYSSCSLRELARVCWHQLREPLPIGGKAGITSRAMSTGDFPYVLENVAKKLVAEAFEASTETWRTWSGVGSLDDFRPSRLAGVASEGLDLVPENSTYTYGSMADTGESVQLATYGKIFAITRQAIINDDLELLTRTSKAHGEAAARKIGDVVYAVLTSNAVMGDGVNLFHADHGNVGTPGALSSTTLAEAIKLMRLQKDALGERTLNIPPQFFIAPASLEGSSEVFFGSQYLDVASGSTVNNPYTGSRFTRVYEPRLDENSATAWYIAGPKGKTVTVYFLRGQETPTIEQRDGWAVDGIEFKVRIDVAAMAVDYRGLTKNAGA